MLIFSYRTLPPAFCSSKDSDHLCIVFRALVPKDAWGWNSKSKVYMRFGGDYFGKFNFDFGPGDIDT